MRPLRSELDEAFSLVDEVRILEFAEGLIRVPSVTGGEREVVHRAKEFMEESGVPVELRGSEDRPVVVSMMNPGASPLLVFNGHLDTVPVADPEAWTRDPFDPVVEDGRLYGRGACDMKSSCAVIIHVLEILNNLGVGMAIGAQLVPDEERGGVHGTRLLLGEMDKGLIRRPDYVVIGEKSNLKVRIAERGSFRFSIRFGGRATHTAYSRTEGVNAIAKASKGVLALERHIDKYHEWIGHPVISVNSIQAGTVPNQVPAECFIGVDRRLIIGEDADTVVSEVTEALNKAGEGDSDWRWELEANKDEEGNYVYSPPSYTAPDTGLVKAFFEAVPKAMGSEPELFVEWAGGTDGRFYRYSGIQTVGFGPRGEHAHGPNEFVYVDSLVSQAKVYLALVLELAK
ncbi:MAG: ArgE/DapE family deacylase [Candidatus Bathyarchaeota archaeon]|nr:ArgE/DapE family deacylase [Candidatus Bathyarchaeota archaeon]